MPDDDPSAPAPGAASGPSRRRWVGPLLLAVMAGGLVAAAVGAWRPGLLVVGGALAVAAALRVLLPEVRLGTLAVRARWLDVAVMLTASVLVVVVTLALP